ncbi:hypothetical protein [uncultured Pseudacidovorax sp.]|uniref:hypothetical protein n=1 Tax=uncultured Pseudacidovorax sp. TaxID=679313 RepID=UPI0025E76FDD|nr:hypothetical protein [uncultured Pseudacidovorax sp.]
MKGERISPLTGLREVYDTGLMQEYAGGKPIGEPFRMPGAPDIRDFVAAKLQGRMSDAQPTTGRAHITSPDNRSLADHYRRNGESAEQAADRLADAASRFQINRHGAAVSSEDANGVRYLSGGG